MEVSTFFTRLLHAPKTTAPLPPDNLDDFDLAWEKLVDTLEHPDERQLARGIGATDVPANLKHIVDALVYESNRTDEDTTGACLEYFLRRGLLGRLEALCEADRPRGVKAEVLKAVNNLVVLMSERFLIHNAVHRPLRRLLKSCVGDTPVEKIDGAARIVGAAAVEHHDDEVEENLVDLMCILCSRMRAYPPLLLIFFHDRGWLVPHTSSGAPAEREGGEDEVDSATHFEFLLFSYLLRYVHRDGRTGDFARAGLLFLFDIAFLTPTEEGGETLSSTPGADGSDPLQDARDALAEYVLDGDFADVMAAGLGATFSLLPNKLRVPSLAEREEEDGGVALGSGDRGDDESDSSTIYSLLASNDEQVHAQLDLLLRLLGFLQDILHRCRSPQIYADPMARNVSSTEAVGSAVADATLDALQTAFVDNVLYPSILECSSSDGSAVAVLTYLDVMFANLDDGPVLQRVLDVLMDAESSAPSFTSPRKRKTGAMEFVSSPIKPAYATEGRFTLRDLILDNLKSGSPDSEAAALHLLQTLLSDHCSHSTPSLLSSLRRPNATALARPSLPPPDADMWLGILPQPVNSTDVHLQEPELYSALVPRLDDAVQASTDASGFGQYLVDAHALLQADHCWQSSCVPLQFISDDGKPALLRVGAYDADPNQHALNPNDTLVHVLLDALTAWFTSPPDKNVALTGALSALVRCPNRNLASWLLYDIDNTPTWDKTSNASDESFDEPQPSRSQSPQKSTDLPALYQVLRELVRHIGQFRASVPDFDRLLNERRQGLQFAEQLEEAMVAALEPPPPPVEPPTPTRKISLGASIRNLWSPRKQSLFGSPRGSGSTPPSRTSADQSQSPLLSPPPRSSSLASPSPGSPVRSPLARSPLGVPASLPETPSRVLSPKGKRGLVVEAVNPVTSGPWVKAVREDVEGEEDEREAAVQTAPLTSVLDNCIVLEELVKELVAIIIARRALGIDQVGFV